MKNYTRYNDAVNSDTARHLLDLNRRFYSERGHDFAQTRTRLQPGVIRLLGSLRGGESILDLGCATGELALALSRATHHGSYLGVDFSLTLLSEASRHALTFPARFRVADLSLPDWGLGRAANVQNPTTLPMSGFDVVFAFAVLHHIPSRELHLAILRRVHSLLKPDGRLAQSNWQFLSNPRLRARIQAWDAIGLASGDIDPGDYLLDWRHGGKSLRYVHHFDEAELSELASATGFSVSQSFYSDGANRRSGLYQIWRKA